MNKRFAVLLSVVAGLVVVGSLVYLMRSPQPSTTPTAADQTLSKTSSSSARPGGELSVPLPSSSGPASSSNPALSGIEKLFARLRTGEATDADLDALRRQLLGGDPQVGIAAIHTFLDSGRDAATRQELTLEAGGTLAGAPTMRTFLLDLMGQLSKKINSPAAALVSRQILESKQSSDEWAIALRNVAWQEPQSKPYLAKKMREMLTYEPWKSQPSAGFLESFDVVVYSQDPSFIPDLAGLVREQNDQLRRAAAVALDRLSAMAPLEVMNYLNTHPNELSDRPFLRADYYAKADLSSQTQRQALETYLARGDVSVAEKTKLLQGLVTPAAFVSDNLLTVSPSVDTDDSPARDQQLLQTLNQWAKQNRYPELQAEIAQVQERIGM